MKKTLFIVLIFAVFGGLLAFNIFNKPATNILDKPSVSKTSPTKSIEEKQIGVPSILIIPTLGVNVSIEQVGLAPDGRMAVPTKFTDTGWYKYGPRPGEVGNSVIAGHFDTPSGTPSVFWDLKNMQKGDQIKVIDDKGKEYIFSVTEVKTFSDASFPLELVFGKTDKKMLNLITCAGTWDSGSRNYSDRVVAFSELVE